MITLCRQLPAHKVCIIAVVLFATSFFRPRFLSKVRRYSHANFYFFVADLRVEERTENKTKVHRRMLTPRRFHFHLVTEKDFPLSSVAGVRQDSYIKRKPRPAARLHGCTAVLHIYSVITMSVRLSGRHLGSRLAVSRPRL